MGEFPEIICNMNFLRRVKKAITVFTLPYEIKPPYTHMVQIGDPVLRHSSMDVHEADIKKTEIQKLIRTMLSIMKNDNLAGISAPQLGVPIRIMAMQCPTEVLLKVFSSQKIKEREMSTMPSQIFINPNMKVLDYNTNIEPEMCGSVLSFMADVKRYNAVELSGLNESGEKVVVEATGYIARIIQHEMDHLNGVLFTDLMNPKTLKCCIWNEVNQLNGYVELNYYPKA